MHSTSLLSPGLICISQVPRMLRWGIMAEYWPSECAQKWYTLVADLVPEEQFGMLNELSS